MVRSPRYGSSHAFRHVEDDALLTGAGRFANDVTAFGQAYLRLMRSPHPHARIAALDTPRLVPRSIDSLAREGA